VARTRFGSFDVIECESSMSIEMVTGMVSAGRTASALRGSAPGAGLWSAPVTVHGSSTSVLPA